MKAWDDFLNKYETETFDERLGQSFVTWYVEKPWPELYYQENDTIARMEIVAWLLRHHYFNELPKELKYDNHC